MKIDLVKILEKNEYCILTGDLIKILDDGSVENRNTLERRVQRAVKKAIDEKKVSSIDGIWEHNQRFIYLPNHYKSVEFYDVLVRALNRYSYSCYSLVDGILKFNGIIPKSLHASYTCSTVLPLKGHRLYSDYLDALLKHDIIIDNGTDEYEVNGRIHPTFIRNSKWNNTILNLVRDGFSKWGQNINMIAWNKVEFDVEFGKFQWMMKAPSYLSGLTKNNNSGKATPGFALADFLLFKDADYDKDDIKFFTTKIDALKQQAGIPNILFFLVTDRKTSQEAYQELKKRGIVIGNVENLFGKEFARSLAEIKSALNQINVKADETEISVIIDNVIKLSDGKVNNMRGDLLELSIALLHLSIGAQDVEVSKRIKHEAKQREIDIMDTYREKIIFCECKAYSSMVDLEIVQKWCTEKIPVIHSWYLAENPDRPKKVQFEFWAVNGLTDEAREYLPERKNHVKKYSISFFERRDIETLIKEYNLAKFKEVLRAYFPKKDDAGYFSDIDDDFDTLL